MSVTHLPATIAVATDAVTALIGASGKLVFRTTGTAAAPGTEVATLALATDAFGDAAVGTGIATAGTITQDSDATGGTVATATLETSGASVIIHAAVTAASGDYNMSNSLVVGAGDIVTCTSLTYKAIGA